MTGSELKAAQRLAGLLAGQCRAGASRVEIERAGLRFLAEAPQHIAAKAIDLAEDRLAWVKLRA